MRELKRTGRTRHRVQRTGWPSSRLVCVLQIEVERPEVTHWACGPETNLQPRAARLEWIDARPEDLMTDAKEPTDA